MAKRAPHPKFDYPMISESEGVRYMHFSTAWMQGAMQLSKPDYLVFEYTQQMCSWLLFLAPPGRQQIGILGLGAASFVRFVMNRTRSPITIVEWNPIVTACCQQYFKLKSDARIKLVHANANQWVQQKTQHNSCQILLVDLYDYAAQGPVCDSLAFYKGCHQVLGETGIVAINLFGHHASYEKNISNILRAFDGRVLIFNETPDGNRIVLAFKGPELCVSGQQLLQRAQYAQRYYGLPMIKFIKELLPDLNKDQCIQI